MLLALFTLFSLIEATRHWYIIRKLKHSPNKAVSFTIRLLLAIGIACIDPHDFVFSLATLGIVDWWIHDYYLNILLGNNITYLNSTGPIDKFQNEHPNAFVWFVWKTIVLIGLVGAYYFN